MAVKTITIDIEAYETIVRARRGNESFSTVIKETLGPAHGALIPVIGLLIGISAKARSLPVLTRDVRHFSRIPALVVPGY